MREEHKEKRQREKQMNRQRHVNRICDRQAETRKGRKKEMNGIKEKQKFLPRNDSASVSNDNESSFTTQKQGRGFALNSA